MKAQILQALQRECEAIEQIEVTLTAEAAALRDRDSQRIEEIAYEKQTQIESLESLAKQRRALGAGTKDFDYAADPILMRQWTQLKQALEAVKRKNAANGIMINASNNFARRALDVLFEATRKDSTYTASGKQAHLKNTRYSTSA